jgi:hypothetical protein
MKERQDPQKLILIPGIVLPHTPRNHQHIRDDIPMTQHNPLRQPRRPARIRQERQISIRIQLPPPIPTCPACLAYTREMLEAHLRIPLLAEQYDSVLW